MASSDFHVPIEPVALRVLPEFVGEPNRALSSATELRFGKNGSLSVDLQKQTWHDHEDQTGGGVLDLLQAYRGYSKQEAVEWLQDEGFLERRDKPEGKNGAAAPKGKFAGFMDDHPIATFQYFDAKNRLAYEVLKFEKTAPRRYMQRRPHLAGGWIWGLTEGVYGKVKSGDWFKAKEGKHYAEEQHFDATPWWLYHRDEVVAAVAAGKPIVLVEGEKDVETLRAWGFVATTNQGGAKNWHPELNDDLRGARVIICSDIDASGNARTLMRGAELRGIADSVKVIDLSLHWKDAPDKSDVTDWKEKAGGTAEKFAELVRKAPPWKPEPPKSRFNALTWDHLDDPGPELDFLVDGWLTVGERSIIGGPSRSGKSFLAIHTAMCVARGVEFFGNQVLRGGVVYQAGEGARGVKRRLKAYRKHFDVADDADVPFVFLGSKVDLYSKDGDTQALIEEIKAWALTMSEPLRLVVIDTLATATSGADENSGKDMSIVLANIARISDETGAHVMLVHHMNADGKKLRGHTSIFGNVDQVITVTMDETTKVRTAVLSKQKDDEDGLKLTFLLGKVDLGHNARTGREISSCVVLSVDETEKLKKQEEAKGFQLRPTEQKIMNNLFAACDRYGRFIKGDGDGPVAAKGKIAVEWKHYREIVLERMPEEEDRKRAMETLKKEFQRNRDAMIKFGIIGMESPWLWWTGKPLRGFARTLPKVGGLEATAPSESPGMQDLLDEGIQL